MKTIVIFYSLSGDTKKIAEAVSKRIGADILELKPQKELNPNGFAKYLWGGRQVVMGHKPKLAPLQVDLSRYEAVIIGSPVWAFSFAPPLKSFITSFKIENKKIAFFVCHDGGLGKTFDNLAKALPNNSIIGQRDFEIHGLPIDQQNGILKQAEEWASSLAFT